MNSIPHDKRGRRFSLVRSKRVPLLKRSPEIAKRNRRGGGYLRPGESVFVTQIGLRDFGKRFFRLYNGTILPVVTPLIARPT